MGRVDIVTGTLGKARIRAQISAAHSREDPEFAIKAFVEVKDELKL